MIKAQQDTDRNKSKSSETTGLHLYALLSHQTLSVIAPIFPKLVFVIEAPRPAVPVKLWNFVRNSQRFYFCLSLYPYPKFRPPKWRVLHWIEGNIKMKSQYSDMAKFSLPSLHGRPSLSIRIHLTFMDWVVRFGTTACNQVFSYSVINWYNTLLTNYGYWLICSCTTSIVNSLFEFTKRPVPELTLTVIF